MNNTLLTKEDRNKIDNQFFNLIDSKLFNYKYEFLEGGIYEDMLPREVEYEVLTILLSSEDQGLSGVEDGGEYKRQFIGNIDRGYINKSNTMEVSEKYFISVITYLEQFGLVEDEDIIVEKNVNGDVVSYNITIDYTNNFSLIYDLVGSNVISTWGYNYRCIKDTFIYFKEEE